MLRVELDPNGEFNTTEFGTVKNQEQFNALYAYSPYHHVRDGVAYPAVLMQTGDNDGRVNPMHSRKMTARLQAATSSKYPILLATSSDAGHGIGSPLSVRVGAGRRLPVVPVRSAGDEVRISTTFQRRGRRARKESDSTGVATRRAASCRIAGRTTRTRQRRRSTGDRSRRGSRPASQAGPSNPSLRGLGGLGG